MTARAGHAFLRVRWGSMAFAVASALLFLARQEGWVHVRLPSVVVASIVLVALLAYGLGWGDGADDEREDD